MAQLEYRRTGQPGGGWPGTFDDVLAGVAELPALAAEALARPGDAGPRRSCSGTPPAASWRSGTRPPPRRPWPGCLALAPVADLAEAYRRDLDGGAVAALLGGGPAEVPDRYADGGSMRAATDGVPTVVIHGVGGHQVPVAMSRDYVAAARAAGAEISLVELPGCEHFGLIDPRVVRLAVR